MWDAVSHFDAVAGQNNWVELNTPTRGTIYSLIIKQVDGDANGFTLALYASAAAMRESGTHSSLPSQSTELEPAVDQVMETLNCPEGRDGLELFDLNRPYVNADTDNGPLGKRQKLYVNIRPFGTEGELRSYRLRIGLLVGRKV